MTVAQAAPETPSPSRKMNAGSRAMFRAAPSTTVPMPRPARPWAMRKLFSPPESRAKAVPAI